MVPQSAEPFFHVCITRRFSPGRKLQSAAAPRTPQALGQHSCTLSVGADRARPTPRGCEEAAPDARRRGAPKVDGARLKTGPRTTPAAAAPPPRRLE